MRFSAGVARSLPLLLAGFVFAGCLPSAQNQSDEEKEPHYLAGKNRVNAMDYKGAIESFEKALEVNPQSGLAQFELGWLFDQKESDPAAAIYHYAQYLKLRPGADNAEMVRTRILACKQELARTVSLGPVTQTLQREFEQLGLENKRLTEENKRLREELEKWRLYYTRATGGAFTNPPSATVSAQPSPAAQAATPSAGQRQTPVSTETASFAGGGNLSAPASAQVRNHTVKPGETPSMIARKYGVKLDALLAANPRLDPRRMRVGQSLVIPGS